MNERTDEELQEQIGHMVSHIQETTTSIGEELTDPGDDWMPMAFALAENHGQGGKSEDEADWVFGMIAVDSQWMEDKDKLCEEILPMILKQLKARAACWMTSSWYLPHPDEFDEPPPNEFYDIDRHGGSLENHPLRKEGLQMTLIADNGYVGMWMAEITRDERDVPYLQEWQDQNERHSIKRMAGRFPDALRVGIGLEPVGDDPA